MFSNKEKFLVIMKSVTLLIAITFVVLVINDNEVSDKVLFEIAQAYVLLKGAFYIGLASAKIHTFILFIRDLVSTKFLPTTVK